MNPVFAIVENEFSLIARTSISKIFIAIALVFAIINTIGAASNTVYFLGTHDEIFYVNLKNIQWYLSVFIGFLAMSLGIISVTNERSRGSLGVLFTKPLYRRDVIIGKFLGVDAFLFLLIVTVYTLYVSLMIAACGAPESMADLALRTGSFTVLLFLNASITLGVVMVFGVLLSESGALIASLAFAAYEWLSYGATLTSGCLGDISLIDPIYVYARAFGPVKAWSQPDLYTISQPYIVWLQQAAPYIVLMLAEVIVLVLIGCMLFSREEA